MLLTSIFPTENSLDKQFGSASLWHIVPAAWLGYFGRARKLVSEQLQKYYSLWFSFHSLSQIALAYKYTWLEYGGSRSMHPGQLWFSSDVANQFTLSRYYTVHNENIQHMKTAVLKYVNLLVLYLYEPWNYCS